MKRKQKKGAASRGPRKRHWSWFLGAIGACQAAINFAKRQPTFKAAWQKKTSIASVESKYEDWRNWLAFRIVKLAYALKGESTSTTQFWDEVAHMRDDYQPPELPKEWLP